jgi:hypothetical protein
MLSRMDTIEMNQPVSATFLSATFEACAAFDDAGDGSPVCAACGWLEGEHEPEAAEVRALPTRTLPRRTPTRLAS